MEKKSLIVTIILVSMILILGILIVIEVSKSNSNKTETPKISKDNNKQEIIEKTKYTQEEYTAYEQENSYWVQQEYETCIDCFD
jgi:flagellar basal body-associated protein FliL